MIHYVTMALVSVGVGIFIREAHEAFRDRETTSGIMISVATVLVVSGYLMEKFVM